MFAEIVVDSLVIAHQFDGVIETVEGNRGHFELYVFEFVPRFDFVCCCSTHKMTPLESISQDSIDAIVHRALPLHAESILIVANKLPKDLAPISRLLVANLLPDEQDAIEDELIKSSGDEQCLKKIIFIKACIRTMDRETFMIIMNSMYPVARNSTVDKAYASNFESLWAILNEFALDGHPDGALFLETVKQGLDDPDDESAEIFLSFYEL